MATTKNDKISPPLGTAALDIGQKGCMCDDLQAEATSDDVLLARSRAGQMAAFGQLVERYQHRLYNAVLRMVANADDAQEITQDAFVRALQGLRQFRGSSGFYTWLFRIGMNLSINFHRRRRKVQMTSLSVENPLTGTQADGLAHLADAETSGPAQRAQLAEEHRRVLAALDRLEPSARAVIVLRDIEDLDYAQIGQILDIPVGTVKSRISRARLTLRNMLLNDEQINA
ncbi:MAG: sigma-70 family RNA polymerase sigma factor [Sedimentisphaerales bacterium]|nr:sigma-70 family RNA polymerase sigma factor [Sedimentisphaerales bacterium]